MALRAKLVEQADPMQQEQEPPKAYNFFDRTEGPRVSAPAVQGEDTARWYRSTPVEEQGLFSKVMQGLQSDSWMALPGASSLQKTMSGLPTAVQYGLGALFGQIVFHGSPSKFSQFKMSKVGTGEGAQAYGHGLYFAEKPEVAKSYMKPDNRHAMEISALNKKMTETATLMERDQVPGQYRQFKSPLGEQAAQYYDSLMEQRSALLKQQGHLYKADLPDESIAKMLDWDKPLAEQPEIMKVLPQLGFKKAMKPFDDHHLIGPNGTLIDTAQSTGESILTELGTGPRATRLLSEQGIPGIKYFDQSSRVAKEGTSNYVVFDEKLPKIIKRD